MRVLQTFGSVNGPTQNVEFKNLDEELRFLRNLVSQFRMTPQIRNLAIKIIKEGGCEQRDKRAQSLAIGEWTRANIYYVHELPERFQYPNETLRLRAGDCDDFTTLICSLLESIGIPSTLVAMNVNGMWSHIFPAANMSDGMLPLDATNRFGLDINPIKYARDKGKKVMIKVA